jgi:hypothetical protein
VRFDEIAQVQLHEPSLWRTAALAAGAVLVGLACAGLAMSQLWSGTVD